MNKKGKFSPEKTQAWTFAVYPAVILGLTIYLTVKKEEITTNIIGLYIGLITAGSLTAAVKKRLDNGNSDNDSSSRDSLRDTGDKKLERKDRGGTDHSNHRIFSYRQWSSI